jgi:hypothetical protein
VVVGLLFHSFASALPQQAAKGLIHGIVLRAGTNEPVVGALVLLQGKSGIASTGTTGTDGKFALKNIEPGQYTLTFGRNGYVTQAYGEKVFGGTAMPIDVREGKPLNDLLMRLTPTGAVSGHIRDSEGQPLPGVQVTILRYAYNSNGERKMQVSRGARSDDHGEYRVSGLTPGRYSLMAGNDAENSTIQNINEIVTSHILKFFPDARDANHAEELDVAPGSELAGTDLVFGPPKLFRIRGRVTGLSESAAIQARPQPLVAGAQWGHSDSDPVTGAFEIADLPPGEYQLSMIANGDVSSQKTVELGDTDLDSVVLTFPELGNISGRISTEGETPPSLPRLRTYLKKIDSTTGEDTYAEVEVDGTFTITDLLPGYYQPSVLKPGSNSMPPGFYLKAATLGGADVLNGPLDFDRTSSAELQILVSSKVATLKGSARGDGAEPAPGIMVVLVPDRHRDRADLYSMAITDENGQFTMPSVTPGGYKVFAWDSIEQYFWFDPAVLARFEEKGIPVRLEELAKQNLDLRVITAGNQP